MTIRLSVLSLAAVVIAAAQCVTYPPSVVPFSTIAYLTPPLANGDRLVVGSLPANGLAAISQLPLPATATRQLFCDGQVQLAPGQVYQGLYVPTTAERTGSHPDFAGLLINPQNGQPLPGGIIPPALLGTVYALRVAPAASRWSAFAPASATVTELTVANTPYDGNQSPTITRMNDGRIVVGWHQGVPTLGFARPYRAGGDGLMEAGPAVSIDPGTGGGWKFGHVLVPLSDGGLGSFFGYSFGTRGQRFDDRLTPVGGELGVPDSNTWPDAAALPNGDIVMLSAWFETRGDLTVRHYDGILRAKGSFRANPTAAGPANYFATITAAPNGNYTVAWHTAAGDIMARSFNSADQPIGAEFVVNSSKGGARILPSMTYNSRNDLFIAWQGDGDSDPDGIYMRRFNAAGTPLGSEVRVNQSISGAQYSPQVSAGETGEVVISWTGRDGNGDGILARVFDAAGVPLTDEFIVNRFAQGLQRTAIFGGRRGAMLLHDRVVFAWVGSGPAGTGIFLTVFLLNPPSPPPPSIAIQSVTNGASNLPGLVTPGQIVVLYGQEFGPSQLATLRLSAAGFVETQLAGVQVLVNGLAAPLLYVSSRQIGAIVPYGVSGPAAQFVATYQGRASAPYAVNVAAANPAIFTFDASGRGQAAALNQDGSLNTPATPARSGDIVAVYATGEGESTPFGVDGRPGAAPLPRPNLPVTATVGGRAAQVFYAGVASGLVAGLMQVNVQIPAGTPAGDVAVVILVGDAASQSGVTLAVRN